MREVARLFVSATASTSSAGSASGLIRARGVGEDDVDLAQLGGERVDGAAVADVEDAALDAGAARSRRGGRGGADAVRGRGR